MIIRLLSNYKTFATYFSFSIASSALGFVASLILMRLIPPQEFGIIAIFLSIQFFTTPIISFAADNLIAINKSKLNPKEYKYFIKNYISLAYLIFTIIQFIFLVTFISGINRDIIFLLIPISALLKYLIGLASIEYVMEKKSIQYGAIQLLTTAISLVLTIAFIYLFTPSALWRILALILADIIFLWVRYRGRIHLLVTFVLNKQIYIEIMRFGFPLLLAIAPAWALNEADKIIVAKSVDLTSVGLYAAACTISGFMVTFNTSLINATLPKLYAELTTHPLSILSVTKRYLWKYFFVSALFASCFLLTYSVLADVILPEKYASARHVVYWVVFFALSRSFYAILGAVTDYFSMTIEKLKGILLGAFAAILGIYFGVKYFGIIGASIGVGVGYFVLGIILWMFLNKRFMYQRNSINY